MIRTAALAFVLAFSLVSWSPPVDAQAAGQAAQTAPAEAAGKEILQRKCFQCHQASMWSSLRQDRKAWEGVLYRMVGRGALWTEDEIRAMADFLGQTRGRVQETNK
jgi:mono/diheme cytochrome c family protein